MHDTPIELVINGPVVSKAEEGLSSQTTQRVLFKLAYTVSSGFPEPWLVFVSLPAIRTAIAIVLG